MGHENDAPKENGRRFGKKFLLQMFSEISAPREKVSSLEAEETDAKDLAGSGLPENCLPGNKPNNCKGYAWLPLRFQRKDRGQVRPFCDGIGLRILLYFRRSAPGFLILCGRIGFVSRKLQRTAQVIMSLCL